jgi:hypothetical protein
MKKNKSSKKNKRKFGFNKRIIIGALVAVFTTSILTFSGVLPAMYRSSVLSIPKHSPFDGTTYPVKKVPDWVNLSSGEWSQSYSEFKKNKLIDVPSYGTKQLKNGTDNAARNAQTTYSVVYMGNYEFDHEEDAGSHLAVDIKIPEGTPIYAIANGTVIKASTQNDGFGYHIVLQHNNFPTLDDKKAKETIYSSYSHLSELVVSDRDVVKKGDLIAYSGSTGTATTSHLHFQIDNDNAPWHPFWPFTWQEVKDNGLDFFSAVNAGLGQERAIETTINPMKYVQKYIGSDAMYTSEEEEEDDDDNEGEDVDTEKNDPVQEEEEEESSNDADSYVDDDEDSNDDSVSQNTDNLSFEIEVSKRYLVNRDEDLVISVFDEDGNKLGERFRGKVSISSDNDLVDFDQTSIYFDAQGFYFGKITGKQEGKDRVVLTYNGNKYYSGRFEVVASDPKLGFTDVSANNKYRKSIMYLASKGVVQGYSDGTFKPTKQVTRAEAVKLILEGNDTTLSSGKLKFSDTDNDSWYIRYVYTANKKNIASGYADKTFKPNNTVTKAEFLKMLFTAMKVRVEDSVEENPYNDVGKNLWYAPYFAKAKELGVLDDSANIEPSAEMTRQEIADAIYRVMKL